MYNNTMENTFENRMADKIENIFDDALENPHKYARLVLTKEYATFYKPGCGMIRVKEAIISIHKGEEKTVIRFAPGKCEYSVVAIMRNNKYVAYAFFRNGDDENPKKELFETHRNDRVQAPSSFSALLNTERGTISIICNSEFGQFLYTEFMELSNEPSFYDEMLRIFNEARHDLVKEGDCNGNI